MANAHTVRVTFGGAPFLGLWAKPGADYVCIEPWEGLDDDHRQSGDLTEKKASSPSPRAIPTPSPSRSPCGKFARLLGSPV